MEQFDVKEEEEGVGGAGGEKKIGEEEQGQGSLGREVDLSIKNYLIRVEHGYRRRGKVRGQLRRRE